MAATKSEPKATTKPHKCPKCKSKTHTYVVERPSVEREMRCDNVEKFRCPECGESGYTFREVPQ